LAEGNHEKPIAACKRAYALSGNAATRAVGLGEAYALAGRKSDAQTVLRQLREQSTKGFVPPLFISRIDVALGEREQALARLEEAYQERDPYLVWLKAERAFDPLRTDPHFRDVLRRVGLSD